MPADQAPAFRQNLDQKITVLALDIDGVITDGTVQLSKSKGDGESKRIALRDLDALTKLKRAGFRLALVTGEQGPMVEAISERVQADALISGAKDKRAGLDKLAELLGVTLESICFVGDAERDALAFPHIGLSLAPQDASSRALSAAQYVLSLGGGKGAVSEAVDLLLSLGTQIEQEKSYVAAVEEDMQASVAAHQRMLQLGGAKIVKMALCMTTALRTGGKVLFCGNGGSAADSQHAAAELMGRFLRNRAPLAALSLATDTSVLTAVGNDMEYDEIFARQVRGLAKRGDVVVGLSTSGNSENVARALSTARQLGASALSLTGHQGRSIGRVSDICLNVPSRDTPRIQELHILALHSICSLVERDLFPSDDREGSPHG